MSFIFASVSTFKVLSFEPKKGEYSRDFKFKIAKLLTTELFYFFYCPILSQAADWPNLNQSEITSWTIHIVEFFMLINLI